MQGSNEADKGQTLAPGSPAPARTAQVCTTAWRNFYHVPAPAARGSVPSAECGAQRKTLCFSACHCHFKCPLPPDCGSLAALRSLPDPGWQPLQPQPFMGQAEPCLLLTVTPPHPFQSLSSRQQRNCPPCREPSLPFLPPATPAVSLHFALQPPGSGRAHSPWRTPACP